MKMNRLWIYSTLILFIIYFFGIIKPISAAAPASSQGKTNRAAAAIKAGWQDKWNKTVKSAQQEGRVRIYGDVSSETRQAISKPFKEKYGIEAEFVAGKGSEIAERVLREQAAGINQVDVTMVGGTSTLTSLKPKGILQKLDSFLILPDVNDPSAWPNGKFPYLDDDHTTVALAAGVTPYMVVNTQFVSDGDIRSFQDLLKPEYKGKIVFYDPTIGGTGVYWVTFLMTKVYKNDREGALQYLQKFAAQEPIILKDARLQMEWIAKGKYPVAVAASFQVVTDFVAVGAPVKRIHAAEGTDVTAGGGVISIPIKPERSNAAIVMLNWLLTDDGQRNFATAFGSPAVRVGVKTAVRDPSARPGPGEKLIWEDETFVLKTVEAREVAKEIFGPLMR